MDDLLAKDGNQQNVTDSASNASKKSIRTLILGLTGGVFLSGVALLVPFVIPALRKIALPFVPTTEEQVKNVVYFLQKKRGNLIDLGSGDGRLVRSLLQ